MGAISLRRIIQYDPTHTLTLRNRFAAEIKNRFGQLARSIRVKIGSDDFFRLRRPAFGDLVHPILMAEFMSWLQAEVDRLFLSVDNNPQMTSAVSPAWQGIYIQSWANSFLNDAYIRGMDRGVKELRKAKYPVLFDDQPGGVTAMFRVGDVHANRVGVGYTKFNLAMRGIVTDMISKIGGVLSTKLISNSLSLDILQRVLTFVKAAASKVVRAGRTEISRMHHLALVQIYRMTGVTGVTVIVEFVTAGDDRVCSVCASLEGRIFTLDEVEGLIPLHPLCRCMVVPVDASSGLGFGLI